MPDGTFRPIEKPRRVRSRKAIEAARKPYCEHCRTRRGPFEVHHIKSRGAGGGDTPDNLINLCVGPGTKDCHGLAHRAVIARDTLRELVRDRNR